MISAFSFFPRREERRRRKIVRQVRALGVEIYFRTLRVLNSRYLSFQESLYPRARCRERARIAHIIGVNSIKASTRFDKGFIG